MKKPTSIKDIEDNFRKKLRNGHFGLKDKILGGFIEEFYRQQITELLEQIPLKRQGDKDVEKLVKENVIMADEEEDYRYAVCISRVYGYNQRVEEDRKILNNIKK